MNLEFKLMQTAMKALDQAMLCECGHAHNLHHPSHAYGLEAFVCEVCGCPEFSGPRCPKCHGPMNLLRDVHLTRTDGCRKGNLYLCDDPKCNGWEEAP